MDFYALEEKRSSRLDHANQIQVYQNLSQALLQKLKIKTFKTSQVIFALQEQGLILSDLGLILFWPRIYKNRVETSSRFVTSHLVKKKWLEPLLKELRGDFSFAEVAHILQVQSIATYHHWETGRREIPFHYFLMVIDKFYGRLQAFLDSLPVAMDLQELEGLNLQPRLYHQFFSVPWMPTLMLALRLPSLMAMTTVEKQIHFLAKKMNRSASEVESAFGVLMHLRLVKIDQGRLISQPQQFYAIPAISSDKIQELLKFWFSQSVDLTERPGFHRFEQHATTIESKDKIIEWITELREKIKVEVKSSGEPETLIHINWQVAEIL